jgi:sugar-specific transcriptional regulator TrmB
MTPDSNDPRTILTEINCRLGFKKYEANVYFTVLECGRATASEIADRADVPQARIYDTLRTLEDRQLVELRDTRPLEAVAIDPEETFGDIHSPVEEFLTELETRYILGHDSFNIWSAETDSTPVQRSVPSIWPLSGPRPSVYTSPSQETEAISLIKSRETILRYIERIIEAAEYELVLSITPELLGRFKEQLTTQQRSGVTIELLVTPASEAPNPDDYNYRSVATRVRARRGVTTPIVIVADGNYSIYTTQDTSTADRNQYGVVFNQSSLGFLLSAFFDTVLWTTAEELVTDNNDRTFPQQYASIRRCIKDAREHEDEFYASVEGRDVETGTQQIVEGMMVDISSEAGNQIANITIETDEGLLDIGGRVAALEDIEAHTITLSQDKPS